VFGIRWCTHQQLKNNKLGRIVPILPETAQHEMCSCCFQDLPLFPVSAMATARVTELMMIAVPASF
jgi:hypothetical protein